MGQVQHTFTLRGKGERGQAIRWNKVLELPFTNVVINMIDKLIKEEISNSLVNAFVNN